MNSEKTFKRFIDEIQILQTQLSSACEITIICDKSGRIFYINDPKLVLCLEKSIGQAFESVFPLQKPNGSKFLLCEITKTGNQEQDIFKLEYQGETLDYRIKVTPLLDNQNEKLGFVISLLDVAECKQTEERVKAIHTELAQMLLYAQQSRMVLLSVIEDQKQAEAELQLAAKVFEQSNEGIIITDSTHNIIKVNKAFSKITGYEESDALGNNPRMLSSGEHDKEFYHAMWKSINEQGYWQGEVYDRRKDGSLYPELLSIRQVKNKNGRVTQFIGVFSDITERKADEANIKQLANYDTLTGLPNRVLFADRIDNALSKARRNYEQLAVLFIDLDRFKNVNDTCGHKVGDALLIEFSERMVSVIRSEDTASRHGGDEFLLVLPSVDTNGAAHVAQKLLELGGKPYLIGQHELNVTLSIGIAMFPDDGKTFDNLATFADIAMYRAKQEGSDAYCFFTTEMQDNSVRSMALENSMRRALERNEFHLNYQPQISLETGQIIGMEVLLRWQHPQLGLIPPTEFIPIAENSGQILAIGEWVLKSAARQLMIWIANGMEPIKIAVNISAIQFRHPRLLDTIIRIIEETGIPPHLLELELTEGVAMHNPQEVANVMQKLHEQNIHLSIDDFGTGYSSLSYLKRFPVYKLKIDRSFVMHITENSEDRAIISVVINLAKSLGMRAIAEGVETEEQLLFLKENGCNEIQGYYLSKPLSAEQFKIFVDKFTESPE